MKSITLLDLHKSFGATPVLRGIDLQVTAGEFIVFVGPSGCGKSTLLRLIAGLDDPDQGRILIGDREVTHLPPPQRGVAMVFQSYALYPHMNVRRNIAFGMTLARESADTIDRRVHEVAHMLKIDTLLDRLPRELSGGQRQRVAIARAVARRPEVCLFDEPLSNLDAALRAHTRVELTRMHEALGTTVVYVTHDQTEAMTLADRLVVLDGGSVRQVGSPAEVYRAPADLFVAGFFGSPPMNLLAATADAGLARLANGNVLPIPAASVTGPVTLGIRPDDLRRVPAGDAARATTTGLDGTVLRVEELGEARLIHVALTDHSVVMIRDRESAWPARGEAVRLHAPPAHWHVFDAGGRRL